MSGTRSLSRWSLAIAIAGLVTGGSVGLVAQPEGSAAGAAAGCSCTISGGGSYNCASTSSCGAGNFDCAVNCASAPN